MAILVERPEMAADLARASIPLCPAAAPMKQKGRVEDAAIDLRQGADTI
jgi:hypothetical protein